jgi:hypothetical protein
MSTCWIEPRRNDGCRLPSHTVVPCFALVGIPMFGTREQVASHITYNKDWTERHLPYCQYVARPKA